MRARVAEKREVAKGTLLVVFDLLGEEVEFTPGQYFFVTLLDPSYDDERGARRHFSVVTSPNERGRLGFCTRLRDSAFKRSLVELPIGAEVEVEQPKGSFLLPEDTTQPYVFLAGGIGITVFRSMLRYIAEEDLPHRVTLIYSNRDRDSTPFLDELSELEQTRDTFQLVLTMICAPTHTSSPARRRWSTRWRRCSPPRVLPKSESPPTGSVATDRASPLGRCTAPRGCNGNRGARRRVLPPLTPIVEVIPCSARSSWALH